MIEFAKYDCSIAFLLVFGEAYYQEEELKRGRTVDDRTGGGRCTYSKRALRVRALATSAHDHAHSGLWLKTSRNYNTNSKASDGNNYIVVGEFIVTSRCLRPQSECACCTKDGIEERWSAREW